MDFAQLTSLTTLMTPLLAAGVLSGIGKAASVVLGLGLVIFFHELGHFAVAKWCNVHVERFSIGIGPIIWSRQKGETEYALSLLPLGGYVKMLGQDDMDPNQMTSEEIAESPRSYTAKTVWQRMAIISAGVIMNVITGFLFYSLAFRIGVDQTSPIVGGVIPGAPAWEAGLRPGDRITSINGTDVHNFRDIKQAIAFSRGELTVAGLTRDGEQYSHSMNTIRGEKFQLIGFNPMESNRIYSGLPEENPPVLPGLPAAVSGAELSPGDTVTAVNGVAVSDQYQIRIETARRAAEEVVYTVLRSADDKSGTGRTEEIRISPMQGRSLGLWMQLGKVRSLIAGSPAAEAGMQIGDKIIRVNGQVVGRDLDPIRLPNVFGDLAGTPVKVVVSRDSDAGNVEEELTVTPEDIPGWSQPVRIATAPMPISSIGAAVHIHNRIGRVLPGSEAERSGVFAADQEIVRVELEHKDPNNVVPDALGSEKAAYQIDFDPADDELKIGDSINWAAAWEVIQAAPNRNIRLHIRPSPDSDKRITQVLEEFEPMEDWYLPDRGIEGWEVVTHFRKADSMPTALRTAFDETKASGINILMTLRALISNDVSPKALGGPLAIAGTGYQVAAEGLTAMLTFLAFLSINLAVLNFLPIPVLDGGHMVFLIWEAVTRRKPSPRVINLAHGLGMLFLIGLFVFVMYLDVFVNRFGL